MTYQVLARKWRPQAFAAVVGQDPVTRTLQNALASGRVAHAYLFTGPRGVGKTTTARLLAKALACTARTGPEACGACPSCLDFVSGAPVDVMEIDAASNTGVDDIRTLRENVKYSPARGRYKVYIVDEVHMLSTAASNATESTTSNGVAAQPILVASNARQSVGHLDAQIDALAAYVQGPRSVRRHGLFRGTRQYVAGVLALSRRV